MIDFMVLHGYFFVLISLSTLFLLSGIFIHRNFAKHICLNLFAICFALTLYESFLWMQSSPEKEKGSNSGTWHKKNMYIESDIFGYGPGEDGIFTSKKTTSGGKVIYDVRYTIKNGFRYTPNSDDSCSETALFFGCSVTFGTGVNDNQTLSYFFNETANRRYRIFNFGFPGYGPHQMLSFVESPSFNKISINNGKTIAIYSFIPDHIRRCAGYSPWDLHGPKYELKFGQLLRTGNFSRSKKLLFNCDLLTDIWISSFTYKNNFSIESKKPSHNDVLLAIEILKKTNNELQKKGIDFKIVIWNQNKENKRIDRDELSFFYKTLKAFNIPLFFVSDVVNPTKYTDAIDSFSIRNDGHPTPFFYQTVANSFYKSLNQ